MQADDQTASPEGGLAVPPGGSAGGTAEQGGRPPVPSYRALFAIPRMGRILLGMVIARIGGSMLGVAIVLFALGRFGSPALAGIVTFASVAPGLFMAPVIGALLDRHGRTRLIIAGQTAGALLLLAIAALAITGLLNEWLLVALTGLVGMTGPLASLGLRTLFPIIVPRHLWERANAIDSNGYVVATLVGPPAAGFLAQVAGGPVTLGLIALLYGASAAVLFGAPDPRTAVASTGSLVRDAWQGLSYTLRNPTLRGLGVSLAVLNLGWGVVTIVVPVLLLGQLGQGEGMVGIVFAVGGVTGGIGALIAGRWRVMGHERRILVIAMAGMAASTVFLLLSPTLPVVVAVMALTGFLNGPLDVAMFTLRQRRTDQAWMGRAFAVSMSMNFMGYPFGAAIGGAIVVQGVAAAFGLAIAFTTAGAVLGALMLPPDEGARVSGR